MPAFEGQNKYVVQNKPLMPKIEKIPRRRLDGKSLLSY
jgi:hypothetical protein